MQQNAKFILCIPLPFDENSKGWRYVWRSRRIMAPPTPVPCGLLRGIRPLTVDLRYLKRIKVRDRILRNANKMLVAYAMVGFGDYLSSWAFGDKYWDAPTAVQVTCGITAFVFYFLSSIALFCFLERYTRAAAVLFLVGMLAQFLIIEYEIAFFEVEGPNRPF